MADRATCSDRLHSSVKESVMRKSIGRSSASLVRTLGVLAFVFEASLLLMPSAGAVPSYSRRYGMECSGCHTVWGDLNGSGITFRLSGYRAIGGSKLTPI